MKNVHFEKDAHSRFVEVVSERNTTILINHSPVEQHVHTKSSEQITTSIPSTPTELLKAMREVIKNPEHHCREKYATDANGGPVSVLDPAASKFCLFGAAYKIIGINTQASEHISGAHKSMGLVDAVERILRNTVGINPVSYNDNHSHEEVLEALDKAIMLSTGIDNQVQNAIEGKES